MQRRMRGQCFPFCMRAGVPLRIRQGWGGGQRDRLYLFVRLMGGVWGWMVGRLVCAQCWRQEGLVLW